MDVEQFTAELPALFDDFPRSMHPRRAGSVAGGAGDAQRKDRGARGTPGRRFDDVIDDVPNLAAENVLALLNLAASLLAPGESYVEVGTYYGASLLGAMRGNKGDFVAVDLFSFEAHEAKGRKLPAASRKGLEENLRRFGLEGATILEGDAFEVIEGGALGARRVGVYYYDRPRDRRLPRAAAARAEAVRDRRRRQGPATMVGGRCRPRLEQRLALRGAARAGHGPLGQVEPVRALQGRDDPRVGVPRVEHVPVQVAADLDLVEVDAGNLHQRIDRNLGVPNRVVLELEIGCDLHQLGPVR